MMCQKPDRQGGLVETEALVSTPREMLARGPRPDARASDTLFNRSVNSQTADAAVRENIESQV